MSAEPLTERMELGDAIQTYLLSASVAGLSPATLRLYEVMLKRLLGYARRQRRIWLDELSPNLLRAAVAESATAGPAEGVTRPSNWKGGEVSAEMMIHAARAMSKSLLSDGIPMADLSVVKAPKRPERIQPRVTRAEFVALEDALRKRAFHKRVQHLIVARDLAILYLLADTGLRAAEFCALNVGDVDFEEGTVFVHRGKGGKDRVLSIADSDPREVDGGLTLRALRTYLFHREERGLVEHQALWLSSRGYRLQPDGLRTMLSQLCDEAGLDGNRPPHAFRRGWFTESYKQEPMALPVLVARMGWSGRNEEMVRTYTRGADLDLARTTPRPSLAKQWRGTLPSNPPAAREDLLQAVRTDPELRQALLQALLGTANSQAETRP